MASSAGCGASAITRAVAIASSSRRSASTIALTKPIRCASVASTRLPVGTARARCPRRRSTATGEKWGSAELDLGVGEDGVRRRDAHVAQQAEVESAAERGAVDGGDHRLRKLPHGEVVAVRAVADGLRELGLGEFLEVEAGAERAARGGEDDDAHPVIGRPLVERVADRIAHRDGERVATLRLVETQRRHPVGMDSAVNRWPALRETAVSCGKTSGARVRQAPLVGAGPRIYR